MAWHITKASETFNIIRDGIPPRGQHVSPEALLFTSLKDVYDHLAALSAVMSPEDDYALFHVSTAPPALDVFTLVDDAITSDRVSLISQDFASFIPSVAHQALDTVTDPYESAGAFKATMVEMTAREFGTLVDDLAWDAESLDTKFLVFGAGYYIEILKDDRHLLTIGNQGWITNPETTLDDMIAELHQYAVEQRRPAIDTPGIPAI